MSSFLKPRSASFRGQIPSECFSLSQLRFSSLGLLGREKEIVQLKAAYKDVTCNGGKGIVMLSGEAGAGKTRIVKKFRSDIERKSQQNGKASFFASGKFDLHHRAEPYTAFISAFVQLVDNIVALKENDAGRFMRIKNSILEAVGSEGGLLSSIIPNLAEILGKEMMPECDIACESSMAKNRFYFILRQFIHAVKMEAHPIVLFLDDLQWADVESLGLIENIMKDSQLSGILLIGCFRKNEVDESHPLTICLESVERGTKQGGGEVKLSITCIHIGNLDVDTVHDLIMNVLNSSDKPKTMTLAKTVHEKTHGNAFYVIQFLTSLQDEGMLVYSLGTQSWKWNDCEIKSSTRVSDNVVDLLEQKLQKQHDEVLEVLQVAACLGATSDRLTLMLVTEQLRRKDGGLWPNHSRQKQEQTIYSDSVKTKPTLDESINTCIEEGLLDTSIHAPRRVYFVHDQIQSAAYSLIPDDRKKLIQLRIGEVLVEHLAKAELDKMLFVIVELLNSACDLITTNEKRLFLVRLNLRAAKKAMASSAFSSSGNYLNAGIRLLGDDPWKLSYHLSLDLFNTAMVVEYCNGSFGQVHRYANIVTNLDIPVQHKLTAYTYLIKCMGDQGQPGKALEMCLSVLAQLGICYDTHLGKLSKVFALLKMKQILKRHPVPSFEDFPAIEDEFKIKEAKLMTTCGTLASTVNIDLIPLHVLKCIQWTIENGICQYSSICFVGYGILEVACFGNLKEANEFGRLGLSLSKRFEDKEMESHTVVSYLLNLCHWEVPLQLVRKEMLQGYQLALKAGDINHAMMSICFFCCVCYETGEPLSRLEADLRSYCRQMEEFGQKTIRQIAVVIWQSVLNLMSSSDDPVVLSGTAMDQSTLMRECIDCKAVHSVFTLKSHQLQLAYLFERYDLASKLVDWNATKFRAPLILTWRHTIFQGLTALVLARKGRKRRIWRKFAMKVVRKVRTWVSKGHVNCLHTLHLLEGEVSAVQGKIEEAKAKYDLAIATAGRAGFRMDKAISCERAGELFINAGDCHWAADYLSRAHQQYVEWEASAKAHQLLQKHRSLIGKNNTRS